MKIDKTSRLQSGSFVINYTVGKSNLIKTSPHLKTKVCSNENMVTTKYDNPILVYRKNLLSKYV